MQLALAAGGGCSVPVGQRGKQVAIASSFPLTTPACRLGCSPMQGRFWLLAGFANPDSELFTQELRSIQAANPGG